jgi:ribosomal protein S1
MTTTDRQESMKTKQARVQYLVQIHGTEQYVRVSKATVKQLKDAGYNVNLDRRFEGVIYIEPTEK